MLKSVTDPCNAGLQAHNAEMMLFRFSILIVVVTVVILLALRASNRQLAKNPPVEQQEATAVELAHEFQETIHECCQVPLFDHRYLDPVISAFTVGRVTRRQLHDAIFKWLKEGVDYRIEYNKFWDNN